MRIQDIMSRDIKTITPSATANDARSAMRLNGIHHLVVVEGREVAGIISARDVGAKTGARNGVSVRELMSAPVVTVRPDATIRQAANLLRGHTVGCLVVLDGSKPAGIVTTTDLLELIGKGVERPIERSTRWTLRSRGPRRTGQTARHNRAG